MQVVQKPKVFIDINSRFIMKKFAIKGFLMCYLLAMGSCVQMPPEEREIYDLNGKKVNLEMFEKVHYKKTEIKLDEIFRKHEFLSLVYLEDGCAPCYPIYVDWHMKLDSMGVMGHYSVLFIIEGSPYSNFNSFLEKARQVGEFEDKFYTVIDPEYRFLTGNSGIPEHLVKRSITIDKKGKIKLVGVPFASPQMAELFLKITKQK